MERQPAAQRRQWEHRAVDGARIDSDRSGNLQVVWEDARSGNFDIYRTQLAAGSTVCTINDRLDDDGGSGDQMAPDVAYDRDGAAVAVWLDNRSGNYDIYTHRDPYVANVYTYDSLYRLREAGSSSGSTQYQYDPVGNRTVLADTGTVLTYTYDAADRMVTVGGKSATWDANGNMLTKEGVTYRCDSANRLTAVISGTLVATFDYPSNGKTDGSRTGATVNGLRTNYLWASPSPFSSSPRTMSVPAAAEPSTNGGDQWSNGCVRSILRL